MIIDQLPVLAAVQDTDEVPIERGTATYKTVVAALLKSAKDAADAAQETADGKPSLQDIFNAVYPVGAIYTSVNSTSPATLFGGTWEQIQDTFLLAAGSTYAAGSTGGEAKHTLALGEMPSHTHSMPGFKAGNAGSTRNMMSMQEDGNFVIYSSGGEVKFNGETRQSTGSARFRKWDAGLDGTTGSAGSGTAHNNMPPYIAVYVWKRTA